MKKEWLVLLNPHAGVGRGARDRKKIEALLNAKNISYQIVVSEYPKHAMLLIQEKIGQGYQNIIIAGGDGTLNEVVNGVYTQEFLLPDKITIGMLPVGTGNDWIKTFGIPLNYKKALDIILERKIIQQDIGRIIKQNKKEVDVRYFANMAGFGFDALVAKKANKLKDKGRSGLLVYLYSLITSYVQYKTIKMHIKVDDGDFNAEVFSCSIGIGIYNGGGMMQAPGAIPNNGEFQVTLIRKIGIWTLIKNIKGLFDGSFIHDKHVATYTAKKVKLSAINKIPCEADGEILGKGNYHVELLPHCLNVIYGSSDNLSFQKSELSKEKEVKVKQKE